MSRSVQTMRIALLVLLAATPVLAGITARSTAARTEAAACGRELWDLKTLSDPRRNLVYLRPIPTTVAAINARRPPLRRPRLRTRGFERHVWRVTAQITEYKLEADSDIHLVLFGENAYMTAEMPSGACLPKATRDRRAIVGARTLFEQRCGAPTGRWQSLGAVAEIDGVGFWDVPHGQEGAASNYAELHPVTRIRLIAGCS